MEIISETLSGDNTPASDESKVSAEDAPADRGRRRAATPPHRGSAGSPGHTPLRRFAVQSAVRKIIRRRQAETSVQGCGNPCCKLIQDPEMDISLSSTECNHCSCGSSLSGLGASTSSGSSSGRGSPDASLGYGNRSSKSRSLSPLFIPMLGRSTVIDTNFGPVFSGDVSRSYVSSSSDDNTARMNRQYSSRGRDYRPSEDTLLADQESFYAAGEDDYVEVVD